MRLVRPADRRHNTSLAQPHNPTFMLWHSECLEYSIACVQFWPGLQARMKPSGYNQHLRRYRSAQVLSTHWSCRLPHMARYPHDRGRNYSVGDSTSFADEEPAPTAADTTTLRWSRVLDKPWLSEMRPTATNTRAYDFVPWQPFIAVLGGAAFREDFPRAIVRCRSRCQHGTSATPSHEGTRLSLHRVLAIRRRFQRHPLNKLFGKQRRPPHKTVRDGQAQTIHWDQHTASHGSAETDANQQISRHLAHAIT